jgi:hypothetical protein
VAKQVSITGGVFKVAKFDCKFMSFAMFTVGLFGCKFMIFARFTPHFVLQVQNYLAMFSNLQNMIERLQYKMASFMRLFHCVPH